MVKTEQQMQLRQHAVKSAKRSVMTIKARPRPKSRTAPRQAWGYLASSKSMKINLSSSTEGKHSPSKIFCWSVCWKKTTKENYIKKFTLCVIDSVLIHTVRNLHFLSKNSTLISRENCRFFSEQDWKLLSVMDRETIPHKTFQLPN